MEKISFADHDVLIKDVSTVSTFLLETTVIQYYLHAFSSGLEIYF